MAIDVLRPATREQWLLARKGFLGASEAPALLGVHPYLSAFALWAHKTGRLESDPTESSAMRRGRLLEAVAVQMIGEDRPTWRLEPNPIPGGKVYRDRECRLSCTPDLIAFDPEREGFGVVQVKSVEASKFRREWRQDGELTPPLYAVVQAIIEADLTRATWAAVAPIVVGFGIDVHIIDVPIHGGIIERIRAEAAKFWSMVDRDETPAPDYGRDGEVLAELYAQDNGETIDLTGDNELPALLDERASLAADKTEAEKRGKAIKAEILAKMGNATFARIADGRLISAKTTHRNAYTVAAASYRDVRVLAARPNREDAAA